MFFVIMNFCVGVVLGTGAVSLMAKSSDFKWHLYLIIGMNLGLYLNILFLSYSEVCKLINLFVLIFLLPVLYSSTMTLKEVMLAVFSQILLVSIVIGIGFFLEMLNTDYFLSVSTYFIYVLSNLTLIITSYFVGLGYSRIPSLLLTPTLKHVFRMNSLEMSKNRIERAISNIGYQFVCRGLSTPKYEKSNLKAMKIELEEIQTKISKCEKNLLNSAWVQVLNVIIGSALVCLGFWMILMLMGVLIEGVATSECGWQCGFQGKFKLNGVFKGFENIIITACGVLYLSLAEIGFYVWSEAKLKENSAAIVLGGISIISLCSLSLDSILMFFVPSNYSSSLPILPFINHSIFTTGTFLYFIYWNLLKCKDR